MKIFRRILAAAHLPKVDLSGRGRFFPIPAVRYGHCNFTANEVLAAFALAVRQP